MFNIFKKKKPFNFKVVFHKEANGLAEHGTLFVNQINKGMLNHAISFSFVDVTTLPGMNKELMDHLWEQAQYNGYTPVSLRSYRPIVPVLSRAS